LANLDAFRAEVRDWLAGHLPPDIREAAAKATSVFVDKPFVLAWQKILHQRGWVAPLWPREYGGPGWSDAERLIFEAEYVAAGAPMLSPMGLRMVAPCIMRFGTPEQKAHYLPRLLSGDDYWCQGYSEPQSGSDLASLQLRADLDPGSGSGAGGDHYVLNGSKIWTTHAHHANKMFALVRTARDGRPQDGITFLLLDMATPGITVRPIYALSGDHDFNQVFFDNARVPVSGRLGEEGQGWSVAKYLLEFERASAYATSLRSNLARLKAAVEADRLAEEAGFVRRLTLLAMEIDAIAALEGRVFAMMMAGSSPGPMASLLKVQGTECQQRLQELAVDIAGPFAAPDQFAARQPGSNVPALGPNDAMLATPRYLNGRAASIYGGSNEIQRGIMAKLLLGV
jgi:alkylation response protein AidB-like acyl-CoA dehydrogenase